MEHQVCCEKNMSCVRKNEDKSEVNVEEQRILSGQFKDIICHNEDVLHQLFKELSFKYFGGGLKAEDVLVFFHDIGIKMPVEIIEKKSSRIFFNANGVQYSFQVICSVSDFVIKVYKESGETKVECEFSYNIHHPVIDLCRWKVTYPSGQEIITHFPYSEVCKIIKFSDFELRMVMYEKNLKIRGTSLPLALYSSNIDQYLLRLTEEEAKNTEAVYQKVVQMMKMTLDEIQLSYSFTVTVQRILQV